MRSSRSVEQPPEIARESTDIARLRVCKRDDFDLTTTFRFRDVLCSVIVPLCLYFESLSLELKELRQRELMFLFFFFRRSGENAVRPIAEADSQSSRIRRVSGIVGSQWRKHRSHYRCRRAEFARHIRMRHLYQSTSRQEMHA